MSILVSSGIIIELETVDIILPAFFVDPVNGLNTQDGETEATAFKTITKARDAMRTDGTRSHTYLRGGRYDYTAEAAIPIALTSSDNGTAYISYPGETPVFSGGDLIAGASFADEGGGIFSVTVGTASELDVALGNGDLLFPCAHPTPTDGDTKSEWLLMADGITDQITFKGTEVIDADVNANSVWLLPMKSDFEGLAGEITAFNIGAKTINNQRYDGIAADRGNVDHRYRILNNADQHLSAMPSLIGYKGTFGWASATGKLHIKPNIPADLTTHGAVIARKGNMFTLTSCDDITFLGVTFSDTTIKNAASNNESFFHLSVATNITIAYGAFRSVAGAVRAKNSSNNLQIVENEFSRIAHLGVLCELSNDSLIYGNHFHDMCLWSIGGPVVILRDTDDVECSYNYGLRLNRSFLFAEDGGTDANFRFLWEFNRAIKTTQRCSDAAPFYTLGRSRSNLNADIRHNYVDECKGLDKKNVVFAGYGVYLDDETTGVRVERNFINRFSVSGIFFHSGDDNACRHNAVVAHDNVEVANWHAHLIRIQGNAGDMLRSDVQKNLIFAPVGLLGGQDHEYWTVSGTYFDSAGNDDPIFDFNMLAGDPPTNQLVFYSDNGWGNGGSPTAADNSSKKVDPDVDAIFSGFTLDGDNEMVPGADIALTSFTISDAAGPDAQLLWDKMGGPFAGKTDGYDVSDKIGPLSNLWDQFNP